MSTGQEGTPVCWCQTEKTLQATGAEFNCIQVTEITLINSMWQKSGKQLHRCWYLHVFAFWRVSPVFFHVFRPQSKLKRSQCESRDHKWHQQMFIEKIIHICVKTIPKIYPFWAAWKKTSVAESAKALNSDDVQSFMLNLVFYAYYRTFLVVPHINCVSHVESHIGVGYWKPTAISVVISAGIE